MKFKVFILLLCVPLLNITCCGSGGSCCGNDGPTIGYKYTPKGTINLTNLSEKYQNLKDTIRGVFQISLDFETEKIYATIFSLIPMAVACSIDEPLIENTPNRDKLSISIDKPFLYDNKEIVANENFLTIDFNKNIYLDFYYNPNYIRIDERFLYYARFNKGLTKFTISGELENGQKFKFEKEVYLDL